MRPRTGIKTYFRYLLGPRKEPKNKFVIICQSRSGSTLLMSLLNSNPQIRCEGELFQVPVIFPKAFVQSRSMLSDRPVYGFKLLFYHIREILKIKDAAGFINDFHANGYSIIRLQRKNILRQAVSNYYAHDTKVFHISAGEGPTARPKIHIEIDSLSEWLEGIEKVREFEEVTLNAIPHYTIVYEDHLADPTNHQGTLDLVSSWFEIPSSTAKPSLRKVTPTSYDELIENIDEFNNFILRSKYQGYLNQN